MDLNNEANITAEFYHQCRLLGIQIALEVTIPFGRIDIAILNKKRTHLIAIIEAKKDGRPFDHNQIERYKQLGVPVYGLNRIEHAKRLALTIERNELWRFGMPLSQIPTKKRIETAVRQLREFVVIR